MLAARFGRDEIAALERWRAILANLLPRIAGATLRCICRRGDPWCHRGTLERAVRTALPTSRASA